MKHFKYLLYLLVVVASFVTRADPINDYFQAIDEDNGALVKKLLDDGFDPNTPDKDGQVGLYLALRAGSPAAVSVLLRSPKLDIEAVNKAGETPLMMAALRGNLEGARELIGRGARINRAGWSPLHYAATGPSAELVELLIDRGAVINARSPNGTTPLMMAARYGNPASVELLLARQADKTLINQHAMDAADFAKEAGRTELAARLRAR